MVNELIAIAAVGSAVLGAVASTIKGYWASDKGFSVKKLFSALLSSGFTAFGLVNLLTVGDTLGSVGWTGLIVANLLIGYGIDSVHSGLDK